MNNYKILACVVTYNRKELLIRNLNSLKNQKYPCEILVLDNCSTDGTYEYIRENGFIEGKDFFYKKSLTNSGGSGGFYQACEYGMKHEYDYCWLMDDDGYCLNSDTLGMIMEHAKDKNCIYNSLVLQDKDSLTFPFKGLFTLNDVLQFEEKGTIKNHASPFNGTLVSKEIFAKIGFPKFEFFIYGDETEFMQRAFANGVTCQTVTNSRYFHPVNNPNSKSISIFGKKIESIELAPWKLYCLTRNYSYINRTYISSKENFLFGLSMYLKQIIIGKNIIRNIKIVHRARKDAKNENFSLNIPSMMDASAKW